MIRLVSIAVAGALVGALGAGTPLFMQMEDANHRAELLDRDRTSLEQQVDSLEDDLSDADKTILGLNEDLGSLQAEYDATAVELDDTRSTLDNTLDELSLANTQIENLNSELVDAHQDIEVLNGEIATLNAQVNDIGDQLGNANSDIENLNAELDEINAKYPLEDFPDYSTLSDWVQSHLQPVASSLESWFSHALRVQEAGANDGYYISAFIYADEDYIYVLNSALVGDILYVWDPEDSAIYEWWEGGR